MKFSTILFIMILSIPCGAQGNEQNAYPFKVKPYDELVKMFDYSVDTPLEKQQELLLERTGIKVFDVSYRVPTDAERSSAYLVLPPGKGPFPAVVYLNSSGGRDGFLPVAILLARVGVIGLAIQQSTGILPISQAMKHDIVAVKRGFDLLAERDDVDTKRIGGVGHSYGSMMLAVVAGIDHRFKCFVIEGGLLGYTYHLRFTNHPIMKKYMKEMPAKESQELLSSVAPFDAVHYINHNTTSLLFQSARFDVGVSEQDSIDFFNAAGGAKEIRWYESGHEMGNDPAAVKDRVEFLSHELAFPSPVPLLLKDMGVADSGIIK
jgi:cephalosporin-C deacetylase-like acetyl esterase